MTKYHDPLCRDCRGTGRDLGSDGTDGTPMRDGNPVLSCRTCEGTGENKPINPADD